MQRRAWQSKRRRDEEAREQETVRPAYYHLDWGEMRRRLCWSDIWTTIRAVAGNDLIDACDLEHQPELDPDGGILWLAPWIVIAQTVEAYTRKCEAFAHCPEEMRIVINSRIIDRLKHKRAAWRTKLTPEEAYDYIGQHFFDLEKPRPSLELPTCDQLNDADDMDTADFQAAVNAHNAHCGESIETLTEADFRSMDTKNTIRYQVNAAMAAKRRSAQCTGTVGLSSAAQDR